MSGFFYAPIANGALSWTRGPAVLYTITIKSYTMSSYVKESFAIDTDAGFEGYHIPGDHWNNFPCPFFTKPVTECLIEYYNELDRQGNEPPRFSWEGEKLVLTDDGATIKTTPETIMCNGLNIVVYEVMPFYVWGIADATNMPLCTAKAAGTYQFKTDLPLSIETIEQAKGLLTALYDNNEAYHPESNAESVDWGTANPSPFTCLRLNYLMNQIHELAKGMDFDPCGYLLHLDPEYIQE